LETTKVAAEPQSVAGELATLGIAKETNFGKRPTGFSSAMYHAFKTFSGKMTTQAVGKAPRGSVMGSYPGTGGRSFAGSLDVETDADTFPQWLAYALGGQTFHANDGIYSGALSGGGTIVGAKSATVGFNTLTSGGISNRPPMLFAGMQLTIDKGGANPENVTITDVTTGNSPFTGANAAVISFYLTSGGPGTGLAFVHASGVVCAAAIATGSLIMMQPKIGLPTFTMEINRPYAPASSGSICTDYLGCKIDSLALALAAKQGFTAKAAIVAQDMQPQLSPATAAVSALDPYIFEQQLSNSVFCGEALSEVGAASLMSLSLTANNNLTKDNHTAGNGPLVWNFPENVRALTGSIVLGFESLAAYNAAQAAAAYGALPPVALLLQLGSTSYIAAGLPYSISLYFPKIFLGDWTPNDDSSKTLTQTLSLTCAESVPGASDNVLAYCVGGASAAY
jgi:hypothetical protein